jgi:hypothetical protein
MCSLCLLDRTERREESSLRSTPRSSAATHLRLFPFFASFFASFMANSAAALSTNTTTAELPLRFNFRSQVCGRACSSLIIDTSDSRSLRFLFFPFATPSTPHVCPSKLGPAVLFSPSKSTSETLAPPNCLKRARMEVSDASIGTFATYRLRGVSGVGLFEASGRMYK